MKGLDFTTPLTLAKAKEVKAKGYDFVCRYLVPIAYKSKRLTPEEAIAETEAELLILSVFEIYADFRDTYDRVKKVKIRRTAQEAGRTDGKLALIEAKEVGMPKSKAICFAVDWDAKPKDYDDIEIYLRNAFAEIMGYKITAYASHDVIEEMIRRGVIEFGWQTYAWSKGKRSKHAPVYQYKNGVNICGISCDLNEATMNDMFWSVSAKNATTEIKTYPILRKGSKGDDVKQLQRLLNENNYDLMIDGDFGFITESAVKGFQRLEGLTADGIVGSMTWGKLYM